MDVGTAVGTPAAAMTSLAKALDPSIRRGLAGWAEHREPAARTASATPANQRGLRADDDQFGTGRCQPDDRGAVERVDLVHSATSRCRACRGSGQCRGDVWVEDREWRQGVFAAPLGR
ncbi:hypothetical protein GCM10017687_84010 [Streptomyces echinatus]